MQAANPARQGLAGVERQPTAFWEAPAARLVDTQAAGLAGRVRRLAGFYAWRDRGLVARKRRRFRPKTIDSNHRLPVAENVLDREFACSATGCEVQALA